MSDKDIKSPLDEEPSDEEDTTVDIHESKEEALRRQRIRRLLERRLERKRLREELDDFIDSDEDVDDNNKSKE